MKTCVVNKRCRTYHVSFMFGLILTVGLFWVRLGQPSWSIEVSFPEGERSSSGAVSGAKASGETSADMHNSASSQIQELECRQDTQFGQNPHDPNGLWWWYTSDQEYEWLVYDNFSGAYETICGVQWWGLMAGLMNNEWTRCEKVTDYTITFYTDDAGRTGDPVTSRVVRPTVTNTGFDPIAYSSLWYFEAHLDPCVNITEGWISIQAHENPTYANCIFGWWSSSEGDGVAYQLNETTGALGPTNYDRAVCIGGSDSDGDGFADIEDNCPHHYNPTQEDSESPYAPKSDPATALISSSNNGVIFRVEPKAVLRNTTNTIELSLDNPDDQVAALQTDILFDTGCFTVTAVEKTVRTAEINIFQFAAFEWGVRLSATGIGTFVEPGTGPIAVFTVDVGDCAETEYLWDVTSSLSANEWGVEIECAEEDAIIVIGCFGDGVGDVCDNCPAHCNPGQEDVDMDGLGDGCDNCPQMFNPGQEDTDFPAPLKIIPGAHRISGKNDGVTIWIESQAILRDETTTLELHMDNPDETVAAFQIEIVFDTDCFAVTAAEATVRSADLQIFSYSDREWGIILATTGIGTAIEPGTGPIAVLTVDAGDCDGCEYMWELTGCVAANPTGGDVTCDAEDSPIFFECADGVGNLCDNCPDHMNSDQTDTDGDGAGDVCDPCPNDADDDGDQDGLCADEDNCPLLSNPDQTDTDEDGVGDVCDNCPDDPNSGQQDTDEDGLGDACDPCPNDPNGDVDGDGICGDIDNCPCLYNPEQEDSNGDGLGNVCDALRGDVDGNCLIDVLDVLRVINIILDLHLPTVYEQIGGDCNSDGGIDVVDALGIVNVVLGTGTCPPAGSKPLLTADVMGVLEMLKPHLSRENFERFMAMVKTVSSPPAEYRLSQNYPNPFNPVTTFSYTLPEPAQVKVEVYNLLGQLVEVLVNIEQEAGFHRVQWDASDMANGIYFYRIEANEFRATKRMVLMK
ncbi:MAG: thrombospondin type 3 repeat-containing protein [Gemmatimonadota bacterium]|nr:MAG: thrombospondin type 3 repeat-containing protein [Gemmatimonadota bacterium]